MIDAYTIGITLALDNGVAEGIAAIRRDLAALDRTVDASAAGLAQLRASAGSLIAATSADLARLMDSARRAAASLPSPNAEVMNAEPPQVPVRQDKNPEVRDDLAPQARPLTSIPSVAPPHPPPAPLAPASPPKTAERAPTVSPVVVSLPAVGPSSPVSDKAQRQTNLSTVPEPIPTSPRAVSETQRIPRADPPVIETAAPVRRQSVEPVRDAVPARGIDYAALGREMSLQTAPEVGPVIVTHPVERATVEIRTLTRERDVAAPRPLVPAPSPVPSVPSAQARLPAALRVGPEIPPSRPTPKQPEPAAPQAAAPPRQRHATHAERRELPLPKAVASGLPSAARRQTNAAATSTAVEVVLDGAVIGRWMDQRLARAATRPISGTTGFDPRLSPVWTTAPVAN